MSVPVTTAMQNSIANLYIAILGRNPEPAGFAYWVDTYANANATQSALNSIAMAFGKSPEFIGTYGGRPTQDAVALMYQNVLNRAADAQGLAYWTNYANSLINGSTPYTVGEALALTGNALITAAAANTGTADATLIAGKQATAVAAGTSAPTTTYTLTTGIDTASATNFVGLVGTGATLTPGDTLTGSGNNATLTLADTAAAGDTTLTFALPGGVSFSNIKNIVVNSSEGVNIDASATGMTGFTNVTVNAGAGLTGVGKVASQITATATQNATLNVNAAVATDEISVVGGNNVTVGVTNITGAAVITAGTATTTAGAVVVNAATGSVAADTTTAAINANGGTSITVTSTLTGAAVNTTITGGVITATGGAATTSVSVTQSATVAKAATVSGITAGQVDVLDANRGSATAAGTIATVTINSFGGVASSVDSSALTTLNLSGTGTALNIGRGALTATPTANTLALNISGLTTTGAITDAEAAGDDGFTTVNLASTGTASTIAELALADATALNISGAAAVTITNLSAIAATGVITSTNTVGTTINSVLGTGVGFVGGTGADSIRIGQTTKAITLGAGNDVVTINNTTLGAGGSVDGGLGTNTIVANTNGSSIIANPAFVNFTTLRVAAGATDAAEGAHVATGFTALEIGDLAGNMSFTNVAAGVGLTYLATTGFASEYVLANATGTSDVLNVTLSSAANLAAGALTAAGIETVNITNTDTLTTTASGINSNTMTLTAANATTVNISGNATLALTGTNSVLVSTLNASGLVLAAETTAGITYTAVNTALGSSITMTGSNGVDTLVGGDVASGADVINGGAGADAITGRAGNDALTGGAGADTFTFTQGLANAAGGGGAVNATGAQVTAANGADTIVDFISGGGADVLAVNAAYVRSAVNATVAEAFLKTTSTSAAAAGNTIVITNNIGTTLAAADIDALTATVSNSNQSGVIMLSNNGVIQLWYDSDLDTAGGASQVALIGTFTGTTLAQLGALTAENFS